jgi:hypothetical protein
MRADRLPAFSRWRRLCARRATGRSRLGIPFPKQILNLLVQHFGLREQLVVAADQVVDKVLFLAGQGHRHQRLTGVFDWADRINHSISL